MPTTLFARRVREAVGLSAGDRVALSSLRIVERELENGQHLYREGDVATNCTVLMSGFLGRYKIVGDREQIISIHVSGDFPDLQTLQLPKLDHSIVSKGPSRVGQVDHVALQNLLDTCPKLAHVFWRESLVEAAIFREWVCNVAARDALHSIAHLICELAARLRAVGLIKDDRFQLPLIQQDLASATGLSVVHVNRILGELRKRRLIIWAGGTVELPNLEALEKVADFNPDYLHQ
jgi:CRP-like cAMP-binding protein